MLPSPIKPIVAISRCPPTPPVIPAKAGTHMWTAPVSQGRCSCDGSGRLQSYVRPVWCGRMTAGPDGLRGSGPKQGYDVWAPKGSTGCPDPRIDRLPCCGGCPFQVQVC